MLLFYLIFCVLTPVATASPVLAYSTYLRDAFTPHAIAIDSSGNLYLAGTAVVDPSSRQTSAMIVKLNPQATRYLYVRFLGGSVADIANAIAVDAAGNAYVAGFTSSPDFPVTATALGAPPGAAPDKRSFIAKFDPNGELIFSTLLGGSTASTAQSIAVNSAGQIIVTGTSIGSGFPSTTGAYRVAETANHPYLLEVDPTATKLIFSATGIGGSALALDSSGAIYVAGTTNLLDYPTTPGSYQLVFPVDNICLSPSCGAAFQAPNQYVTKIDPAGSKLIYSTALSGQGNAANTGLAVDSSGAVYLTGIAGPGAYPFTDPPPPIILPKDIFRVRCRLSPSSIPPGRTCCSPSLPEEEASRSTLAEISM